MADLANLKMIERPVEIINPQTKEPWGVQVWMMSPQDERLDTLRKQIAQKQVGWQSKNKTPKVDELKADRLKVLFAATTKWEWNGNTYEGRTPELTPLEFNNICTKSPWFMEQLDEAFGEQESFFENAEPN